MPSMGAEMLAMALAVLGWICAFVSCVLPMWKVTAYVGMKTFTTETTWEGIWMTCLYQSMGYIRCHGSYSTLALSYSQQAARILTVASILMGALGLLTASVGAKCTRCVAEEAAKARVMAAAGWTFVLAALAQIIPVSLYAHSIIVHFNDPGVPKESKWDLGAALYLGWAAGAFLLFGGVILCLSCSKPAKERLNPPSVAMYAQNRPTSPSSYKKDFV
ncbi:claudin-4 [Austrofundulus limnaeus]|uniref:Claudin-4 n=1 Tax=Austrofundulus limnaeus TaxID=52670 RepID=A0A2I4CXL1_AUSLI|nr:PREDICTED: claudin-4-like [Austrofundulus limnaeus]